MKLRLLLLVVVILACSSLPLAGQSGRDNVIECRALEAHNGANPAVTVVVFHQRNKVDQERLASMLQGLASENVELQVAHRKWTAVNVFRLKSCFGRGLLVLPASTAAMNDGATFFLRFSPSQTKQ
jgi:hypothetical protein